LKTSGVEGVVDGDRQFEHGVDRSEQRRDLGALAREPRALVGEPPAPVGEGDALGLQHVFDVLVDLEQRHGRGYLEQGHVVASARLDEPLRQFAVGDAHREGEGRDRHPGEALHVAVPDAGLGEVHADARGQHEDVRLEVWRWIEVLCGGAAGDLAAQPFHARRRLEPQLQGLLGEEVGDAHSIPFASAQIRMEDSCVCIITFVAGWA
jgi:hypothetical protein